MRSVRQRASFVAVVATLLTVACNTTRLVDEVEEPTWSSISPQTALIRAIGATVQLTVLNAMGVPVSVSDLTWRTIESNVVAVDATGRVTAVAPGTARIIAESPTHADTVSLEVRQDVATVTVSPAPASVQVGSTVQMTASLRDPNGYAVTGRTITWASGDDNIALVTTAGLVMGRAEGSAVITASAEGKSGSATVTVTVELPPPPPPVATVTVTPTPVSVQVGSTVQLTATLRDASGAVLTGRAVSWTSSSTGIAIVDATGLVTGVAAGTATITATSEGISGTASATVTLVPVSSVTVTPTTGSIQVGSTIQLTATLRDANGNVLSGRTVTWTTSASAVATVSASGLVTGVGAGQATITATSEGKSGTASITVTLVPVASVTVTPSTASIQTGQTVQLTATLRDAAGNELTGRTVSWTSSNTGIAQVSSSGLVTGVAAGSATITATSEGKSGTASISVTAPPSDANDPELPRAYVDTRLVASTGRTITVPAGGDLQAALNNAQPGDLLLLQAGASFVGNFVLPAKTGTGWITIRTSASDASLPAPGMRITPAYASVLPKIISPNTGPALSTAPQAHHYRIIGVEITVASSVTRNYGIVNLGDGGSAQNTLSLVPHDLILDRVYVHGHSTLSLSRCVALHTAWTAVIDSYLSECHGQGFDSQAICGWNGPGPFKIVNNYLEGAGENVMFGGADPSIQNLTPSDIEIRRNHFTRPLAWKGVWTVKNLFELKHAQRVLVEGNVFENHWPDAQAGFAILFMAVSQNGTAPWSVVRDVTFRLNVLRNVSGGINLCASCGGSSALRASHIKIAHNLFYRINEGNFSGHGRLFQVLEDLHYATIEHNTTVAPAATHLLVFGALPQAAHFIFRNNVASRGQYGVFGTGMAEGTAALDYYAAPGYIFQRNVIIGANAALYPADNFFPATIDAVGFVNPASDNYRLLTTSPYARQATDGSDPGADIDAVERATQGVVAT